MNRYFHLCPVPLEPGSVIRPGNFGRVIDTYRPGNLGSMAFRELAFEVARLRRFPQRPSRMSAVFLFPTAKAAIQNLHRFGDTSLLYEVELIQPEKGYFHADMGLINNVAFPSDATPAIPFMINIGLNYWRGKLTFDENSELLTESAIRIISEIDLSIPAESLGPYDSIQTAGTT